MKHSTHLTYVGVLFQLMAIYGWEFEQFQFASKDAHLVRCRNSMAQTAARGRMKPQLGGPMMTAYLSRADTCVYRHHPRVDRRVFFGWYITYSGNMFHNPIFYLRQVGRKSKSHRCATGWCLGQLGKDPSGCTAR